MVDRGGAERAGSRTDRTGGSSEEYEALVDSLGDGVYRLDADDRFATVNDAIVELTGYSRDELLGEHVSILFESRDVDRLERELLSTRETGDDVTVELILERADGDRLACEWRCSPLVTDGEYEGTVGTVREREEIHDDHLPAVWETYESIASAIDEADVGVFVLDDEFDVAWIDESIEEYFGLDRTEVIGRNKRTLIEETIRDRVAEPETFSERVLSTYDDNTYVEQFECRITSGDDRETRWLEHRSTPIESGRYAGGRLELYYDITDRKESERAHRESELRFQSLVDAIDEYAIFMLDPDGYVVSWNDGARRIKGYESTEILGEHFSTFYTETDRADGVPDQNLSQAQASGTVEDEGWRVRADGSTFWANVSITAIRENGELQGYAKITRDMTDRRAREQQLQRERDLNEQLLETSSVGIAVVTPDGSIGRANERMTDLLGLSADGDDTTSSATRRTIVDEDDGPDSVANRLADRVFETGESLSNREVKVRQPDGRETWLSITATPVTDERDEPERVVVTATDVTDLKESAERHRRQLEEREKELDAVRLATTLLETNERSVDTLIREFVTSLPEFFRYPDRTGARVVVGDHEQATDDYDPRIRTITSRTETDNGTPIRIDVTLGEPVETESTPFLEEERELIDTLATLLTFYFERREYIDDLQAETRRLEQFAYAASHDLQEPLRMVSSYLRLIEDRYGDALDEDGREFLAFAVNGADRMREMIDGLLAYSRVKTSGEAFEPVDLNTVLEDVLSDLEVRIEEHDAEITVEDLPRVEGDASQLRQVFQNLLDNAIEYSEDAPTVHVSADRTERAWEISVRDDGIGTPADETDRIFEVFERLHGPGDHPGTGIGLALCRRIVERHGGDITVDSTPGEGSTFTITLPPPTDSGGD
ncbi:PAS domain S-box protein [Natronolimnohabitans sp. A-GB9]|uniref:PAS domain S-box protein n=1 Tax=Natronolimnohabitans sp. A-GB9 TaxID=3069757 RepID=UPI0027B21B79|nr:PAS domain S-box protein [Natronolimnohabitans sp. A-GB9]MDQ2048919.1 PAS domain S-box protein [Natronolimnohabitans sp. A-GB9]